MEETGFGCCRLIRGAMNSAELMPMTAVESTTLAGVAYDSSTEGLRLEFRSRAFYCYFGVPPAIWQQLMAAESKGAYFNRYIRGRFPFQRLA
jgi:hypothetical protein